MGEKECSHCQAENACLPCPGPRSSSPCLSKSSAQGMGAARCPPSRPCLSIQPEGHAVTVMFNKGTHTQKSQNEKYKKKTHDDERERENRRTWNVRMVCVYNRR